MCLTRLVAAPVIDIRFRFERSHTTTVPLRRVVSGGVFSPSVLLIQAAVFNWAAATMLMLGSCEWKLAAHHRLIVSIPAALAALHQV
jgi:hypothetical protein